MKTRWLSVLLALMPTALPAQALPPASVAVAFDRASIRPVLVEGEADRGRHRLVSADDPVRIASISKLVTALAVLRLVDQGKLDLDRDIGDYLGYPVRNPAFPDRPVTLRLLMSHQSSLLDGDDLYLIPFGTMLRDRLADPRVWDSRHAPGSGWFHYTNLNFPVIASVIETITGERFDVAMRHLVLVPLGLEACYNWGAGCTTATAQHVVVLYRATGEVARDDRRGYLPACPVLTGPERRCDLWTYRLGDNGALFSPQGGLYISMRELARIGQLLANGGRPLLSRKAFAELTGPAWRFDGTNGLGENGEGDGFFCAYGLALHTIGAGGAGCHDDLFGDGIRRIGHSGDAYGLKAGLWVDPKSGKGLAFFTTAVPDNEPKGRSAFTAREEDVVRRASRQMD